MLDQNTSARFSVFLTGGIGCGKTTVSNKFAERGATIVDTDVIAHQVTAANGVAMNFIRAQFGEAFVLADGAMNRPKMRELAFSDPEAKTRLESILHPLIRSETAAAAARSKGCYVMFVVPLLIESGNWKQRLSRVLVVDCSEETQISRVGLRSALDERQVRAIMATQVSRATRLAAADDVLLNEGDAADLDPQIDRLHALYSSLAKTNTNNRVQHL